MIDIILFKEKFDRYKSHKIFLYGTGIRTKQILENVDYNFIALMDKNPNNINSNFYGLKVVDYQEAIDRADIIIIASANVYFQTIFSRIEFLKKEYNIPIYFCDGTEALSYSTTDDIKNNQYWDKTLDSLKKEIDKNEVISFDIFDTLVTRKTTEPMDLFHIIERRLNLGSEFVKKRLEVEQNLRNTASLKKIYNQLPKKFAHGYEVEKELEMQLCIARKDVVDAFNYAIKQGKELYLITDIYHDKNFVVSLLEQCGIYGYKDIFISCELGKRKSDNTLWEHYKEIIKAKKALHVGDNKTSDIKNAANIGINTYHILSPYEMLKNSTMRDIVPKICTLDEAILTGNIVSKIFNSPFSLSNSKGIPKLTNLKDIGYLFFAPILFHYVIWILQKNIQNRTDTICFVARDGYFLEKLYNLSIKILETKNTPKVEYLMISRGLVSMMSIESEQDIKELLQIKFHGQLNDYFTIRFGIDVNSTEVVNIPLDLEKLRAIIDLNKEKITQNSKNQRELYLSYLDSIFNRNEEVTIVDPSYNGTIQHFLSKLLNKELKGYYCTANLSKSNHYFKNNNMYALFQSESDKTAKNSNVRKNTLFFEDGILVAPEGTCKKINEDMSFEFFDKGYTQNNFKDKELIYEGIVDFFKDSLANYNLLTDICLSPQFVDFLVGEVYSDKTVIDHAIKESFYYDSVYEKIYEGKIFE